MGERGNHGLNLGPPTGQDKIRIYPLSRSMQGRLGRLGGWHSTAIQGYTSTAMNP